MPRAAERDEARLGRWTIGVILVAAAAVIAMPTVRERSRHEYILRAPPGTDLHGISVESKVRIGGIERGRVVRIEPLVDDRPISALKEGEAAPEGRITGTDIVLAIDRGVQLFPGAKASIERGMISGLSSISIPSLGDAAGGSPLGTGQSILLDPADDPIRTLLDEGPGLEERYGWITPAFRDTKAGLLATNADLRTAVEEVRGSWDGLECRTGELMDRFKASGTRLDGLLAEIARLRDDFEAIEAESSPLVTAIEADLAEIEAAASRIGERVEPVFPRTRDALSREFERLASGLHAIEARFRSLALARNSAEFMADAALAGGQLQRFLGQLLTSLPRFLRNDDEVDRIQERFDLIGRDLLAALDEARAAEAALRLVAVNGSLPAEILPRLGDSMERLAELLGHAARIGEAYRALRIEAIPARPAP